MTRRLLIVDDNAPLARVLRMQLESTDRFEVRVEPRSTQALATIRDYRPCLVILDVMMPELDGGRIAALMKADAELARLPVIFLTGSVRKEEVADRDGLIGGMPFLAKPVHLNELLAWIDKLAPEDEAATAQA